MTVKLVPRSRRADVDKQEVVARSIKIKFCECGFVLVNDYSCCTYYYMKFSMSVYSSLF